MVNIINLLPIMAVQIAVVVMVNDLETQITKTTLLGCLLMSVLKEKNMLFIVDCIELTKL